MKRLLVCACRLTLCVLVAGNPTSMEAQDKSPVKYGKLSPADFNVKAPDFDTAADAVVVADIGSSSFVGNNKGWFSIEFKHYKRIKILNKQGFEAAKIAIPLYVAGNSVEKLDNLKACTYNLENGKVVETKLDDKSIFSDKISKHLILKKFTFPALKEGSIIEVSYTQSSDFLFNLQPWAFQGEYPCLWSEYEVDMPNFFEYVTLGQGFLTYNINKSESRNTTFRVTIPGGVDRDENVSFDDRVNDRRWVIKNVPSFKEERFTTTTENYIQKLEFQLARYNFPNSPSKDIMGNWSTVGSKLMKSDDFGEALTSSNGWMDEECNRITKGAKTDREKAEKIYEYVRDNFTCTGHGSIYASESLKNIFKAKNGNEAGLNLLLTAMLRHVHIDADPVILSTRSHGFTHAFYPLLDRFNYVICQAKVDGSFVKLDASETYLGFGRLSGECYNGSARRVTEEAAYPLFLEADSVSEGKMTLVFMSNEKKGFLSGHIQTTPGYFESCRIREKVKDKGQPEFFKAVKAGYAGDVNIENTEIDSLKSPEEPVAVAYDFSSKIDADQDLIYFNPMLSEAYKENPFKAADRKYPVEMMDAMDETLTLNMDVPEGYEIDELPKSAKVLFNENEGFFEYLVFKSGDAIQFRSRIKLNKANFKAEDYAVLRDFFAFVVKKQSEQIVFKKKK